MTCIRPWLNIDIFQIDSGSHALTMMSHHLLHYAFSYLR